MHEHAGIGIGYYKPDGTLLSYNIAAARHMNGRPEDFAGKSIFEIFTKQEAEFYLGRIRNACQSDDPVVYEDNIPLPTGDKCFLSTFTRIIDSHNNILGIQIMSQDITERKRATEALQNMQKLESLGVLAGGIAHDFNNLLGGIYGYIDMAGESAKDEKLSRYISKAMNTIERARGLTSQLLTFAKGGAPVRKVEQLFPFVQETAQFALSGSNVSCEYTVPAGLWQCSFDRNQIGQVIDNIIINAKQAMSDGGTISVSALNVTFTAKQHPALESGDYVRVSVSDQGVGIPGNILPRIFDPFYTTKATGHGLGLATCYSIIKRHNGCIDVESEPGEGSTFHVFLPAVRDSAVSTPDASASGHAGSGTFLVMDDEEVMRDTYKDMLEMLGYTVVCTENGREAVAFAAAELKAGRRLAGAVLDLTVPGGFGGKEAVAEIRRTDSETPVFVTSGYADDPVMADPQKFGFTASICKPFMKKDLSDMLNRHLKIE